MKWKHLIAPVLMLVLANMALAVTVNSDFEGGSLNAYAIERISLDLKSENGLKYWFDIQVTGTLGHPINYTILNVGNVKFYNTTPAQVVYSCNGVDWNRIISASYNAGKYSFFLNSSCSIPEIATLYPLKHSELEDFVNSTNSSYVTVEEVFNSTAGFSIPVLKITDPSVNDSQKKVVIIQAGQHGNSEVYGVHIAKAFLEELLTESPNATFKAGLYLNGTWTPLVESNFNPSTGTNYKLKIEAVNGTMKLYINNALVDTGKYNITRLYWPSTQTIYLGNRAAGDRGFKGMMTGFKLKVGPR